MKTWAFRPTCFVERAKFETGLEETVFSKTKLSLRLFEEMNGAMVKLCVQMLNICICVNSKCQNQI
jgi:hypothetical protein